MAAIRPNIVIHDRESKTRMLIDDSVPNDKIIALKEAEKISKYKDLEIEINWMWNVKIVGALGMLRKDFMNGV